MPMCPRGMGGTQRSASGVDTPTPLEPLAPRPSGVGFQKPRSGHQPKAHFRSLPSNPRVLKWHWRRVGTHLLGFPASCLESWRWLRSRSRSRPSPPPPPSASRDHRGSGKCPLSEISQADRDYKLSIRQKLEHSDLRCRHE
jgi:hypothetical protein